MSCDKQAPKPGEIVDKVGTEWNFRLVALQPMAQGVSFQLLRLQSKGL